MYRAVIDRQVTFYDFNQSCGMQLDEENEWVLLADRMPMSCALKMRRNTGTQKRERESPGETGKRTG